MSYIIPLLVAVVFIAIIVNIKINIKYMSEKNLYEGNQSFEVEILDRESRNVYTVLGISEKRSDEIADIVKEAYKEEEYFTDTLKSAVEKMTHINEVIFAVLVAARMHNKHKDGGGSSEIEMRLRLLEMMQKLQKEK